MAMIMSVISTNNSRRLICDPAVSVTCYPFNTTLSCLFQLMCGFFSSRFLLADSQGEWFDSDFVSDARNNFTTSEFVKKKLIPQRLDLVHRYPKAMLWHTDGGWMAPDKYWDNLDWLTYLYVVVPPPIVSRPVSSCFAY